MRLLVIAVAWVLALIALTSCDRIPGTSHSAARAAVSAYLFDPAAGRFTYDIETDKAICGTVNGKNRMGAYVGAQPFIYEKLTDMASIYDGPPTGTEVRLWLMTDTDDPEWNDRFAEIYAKCRFPELWAEMCGASHPDAENEICRMVAAADQRGLHERYGRYSR